MDSLPALLARADIVSIHAPLTDETRTLFSAEVVTRMKPGAILLNTARGPIVSTDAVVDALAAGRLSGAGLDVLETESPAAGQLADIPRLLGLSLAGTPVVWKMSPIAHSGRGSSPSSSLISGTQPPPNAATSLNVWNSPPRLEAVIVPPAFSFRWPGAIRQAGASPS